MINCLDEAPTTSSLHSGGKRQLAGGSFPSMASCSVTLPVYGREQCNRIPSVLPAFARCRGKWNPCDRPCVANTCAQELRYLMQRHGKQCAMAPISLVRRQSGQFPSVQQVATLT